MVRLKLICPRCKGNNLKPSRILDKCGKYRYWCHDCHHKSKYLREPEMKKEGYIKPKYLDVKQEIDLSPISMRAGNIFED